MSIAGVGVGVNDGVCHVPFLYTSTSYPSCFVIPPSSVRRVMLLLFRMYSSYSDSRWKSVTAAGGPGNILKTVRRGGTFRVSPSHTCFHYLLEDREKVRRVHHYVP